MKTISRKENAIPGLRSETVRIGHDFKKIETVSCFEAWRKRYSNYMYE